ncbi:MAG TPA: TOBE domain-containing protein [Vicinamibacterales bacterium]|jgi:molybdopterin-binding protein|nr:TOBE domain-containing protein [Vicinamibacterales bacterium]
MTLMTVRAAAARLGVGYSTLKQWIHQGRVRTTQTAGGHHRISDAELDRLMAHREPAAAGRAPVPVRGTLVSLSARNHLPGYVEEVRTDGILGQVRLRIGDHLLTAVITADAIRELELARGDDAVAIIKSTEVMIARPGPAPSPAPPHRSASNRRASTRRQTR